MGGPLCYSFWWSTTRCQTSTMGHVPVFYEVINLFIKPQNFPLMLLICKLKGLYLIVTVENCCMFFFDSLLMFFLYFVCKLLPNMRKQHTTTVSSEVFWLWLLTWKYCLIQLLFIDVIVIFSQILSPIHAVLCRKELVQLPLIGVIFSATKGIYNIRCLFVIFKCTAHFPSACSRLLINGHNV